MDFKIEYFNHVALNVKDLEVSIAWYQKVLGLKKIQTSKVGRVSGISIGRENGYSWLGI